MNVGEQTVYAFAIYLDIEKLFSLMILPTYPLTSKNVNLPNPYQQSMLSDFSIFFQSDM